MAHLNILDVLKYKQMDFHEFEFDALRGPNWWDLLSPQDVAQLNYIATSLKLASKIDKKYEMIKQVMEPRGFKKLASGTNRVVYRHLDIPGIVAKIALDKTGLGDNPNEFYNQALIKPFCAKMFSITPCGTVGISEKVLPITSVDEFAEMSDDIFDLIVYKLIGKYAMDDIGCSAYMNYGVRAGFGPVLLDYPYMYEVDESKLTCSKVDQFTGIICNGDIDYDEGFDNIICKRCGCKYTAKEIGYKHLYNNPLIRGGSSTMKVSIVRGDEVEHVVATSDTIVRKPRVKTLFADKPATHISVSINRGESDKVTVKDIVQEANTEDKNKRLYSDESLDKAIKCYKVNDDQQTKEDDHCNSDGSSIESSDNHEDKGLQPPFYMNHEPSRPLRGSDGRFIKGNDTSRFKKSKKFGNNAEEY